VCLCMCAVGVKSQYFKVSVVECSVSLARMAAMYSRV